MDYGLFTMPSHPPERSLYDGHQWDLQVLRWADELGFRRPGSASTTPRPGSPTPPRTCSSPRRCCRPRSMRIGPGGFLLPYHHPAELANRVAMLDHLAAGTPQLRHRRQRPAERLGDVPRRRQLRAQHREMTREALDIILKPLERRARFDYEGKYWQVTKPARCIGTLEPHILPLQQPHPPIGVAGLSAAAPTRSSSRASAASGR